MPTEPGDLGSRSHTISLDDKQLSTSYILEFELVFVTFELGVTCRYVLHAHAIRMDAMLTADTLYSNPLHRLRKSLENKM